MAKKSTMSELDETADQIKDCYHRLDQLERKLKFQTMTDAQRESTEKDILQLKEILKKQEEELLALRKDNRSSTLAAFLLVLLAAIIFGIFYLISRDKK